MTRPRGVTLVHRYCLTHLSDQALERETEQHLAHEAGRAADILARLAEIDARRLYATAGYPSMYQYCVHKLRQCEDQACRRIQAARIARRFPAVYPLLAANRLHLSGVLLLGRWLTEEDAGELLALAADRTKAELQRLLAERFPRPDLPERLAPLGALSAPARITGVPGEDLLSGAGEPRPAPELQDPPARTPAAGQAEPTLELSSKTVTPAPLSAPARITPGRSRVAPLSAGRWGLQCTLSEDAYRKFQHLKALLGHAVPSGDAAAVLEFALDAAIARLEKQKFSATERPRRSRHQARPRGRHIPAQVRRAVWARDGGQCTFVSDSGHRCSSCTRLEFDHIEPVARGGESTVANVRLRCRAHNQLAAERVFGAGFMENKRETARHRVKQPGTNGDGTASETQGRTAKTGGKCASTPAASRRSCPDGACTADEPGARAAAVAEVIPWLRSLGLRMDEARRAASSCESIYTAPLEQRVRIALRCIRSPQVSRKLPAPIPVA